MDDVINKMSRSFFKFILLYIIGVFIFYLIGVRDILYVFIGAIFSIVAVGLFFKSHRDNYLKIKDKDE